MLLCYRHNFLFVHIAKTGGTSVRAALAPLRRRDAWRPVLWACSRLSGLAGHRLGIKFPRHAPASAAQEMLPQDFYAGLFKFAFVRNPWELQVSSWHHLRHERPQLVAGCADFEAFLHLKLDPQRAPQYHLDVAARPQVEYVTDRHGRLIVDFVGRYERLAPDFAEACRRIGVPAPPLPHHREAKARNDYRRYYTDATAELVARHYAADITLFGYRFDDPGALADPVAAA